MKPLDKYDDLKATPSLDEFITDYEADDNIWWVIGCGHHQNLFEIAVEQLEDARAEIARLRGGDDAD